jgi:hypothetical protein
MLTIDHVDRLLDRCRQLDWVATVRSDRELSELGGRLRRLVVRRLSKPELAESEEESTGKLRRCQGEAGPVGEEELPPHAESEAPE